MTCGIADYLLSLDCKDEKRILKRLTPVIAVNVH